MLSLLSKVITKCDSLFDLNILHETTELLPLSKSTVKSWIRFISY